MDNLKRMGGQTVFLPDSPSVCSFASTVGKKEGEGPLGASFDQIVSDPLFGCDTWEKAESALMEQTVSACLSKGNLTPADINFVVAGDLINQCTSSSFALRSLGIPFLGVYGACSTMAESAAIAAMLVEGGFAQKAVAAASSHFCSSEKQFRFPLEYGGQRPPSAQWTVTGCGAMCIGKGNGPFITHLTLGKIVDKGITDANSMGAAMAPAFVSTLKAHFEDTGRAPSDYDLILSGDLGHIGKQTAIDLMDMDGYDISKNYSDCGVMIFDKSQDAHAGGSGCGCSASVLCGHILPKIISGELSRVLFIATGALLSPTTVQQGESIPGIAHAIAFSR